MNSGHNVPATRICKRRQKDTQQHTAFSINYSSKQSLEQLEAENMISAIYGGGVLRGFAPRRAG